MTHSRKCLLALLFIIFGLSTVRAESGYDLWLRYAYQENTSYRTYTSDLLRDVCIRVDTTTGGVIRDELVRAGSGMTRTVPVFNEKFQRKTSLVIVSGADKLPAPFSHLSARLAALGEEGFLLHYEGDRAKNTLLLAANTPVGALYGMFHLLRQLQMQTDPEKVATTQSPSIQHRLLNHWDNLDRTVERGYAGFSIWDWHRLPGYIDQRYIDYARANASIGINGTVLTNVNANALVLTTDYIEKVQALADVFRPYGIKVYLTARFSAPIEIGGLSTADPLDPMVDQWWKQKAEEIYAAIPDFGGFLVKANSEGQPGPQNYHRSHAEGANMLADAVAPFGGIVMWRAFVYSSESPEDRAKQANLEFEPLDGQFRDNVVIQVKNGPIDFQPREPFHPLFGAMPETALAMELQITQEYLGQGTSLAYLAPMYKETLDARTYRPEKESTVAGIVDGSAYNRELSVMAGVSNIGNDINWTGHLFGQSNWYAFGRLAWDLSLGAGKIADEWILQTFGQAPALFDNVHQIMMRSHKTVVDYMTPLGLHHIMGRGHHYGPGPWVTGGRADWTSVYYHRADSAGIGFDRTASGSNALAQYAPEIREKYSDPATCPEKYLLWFHHLPWDYKMRSGNTLWEALCHHYDAGVTGMEQAVIQWQQVEKMVDRQRYHHTTQLLQIQLDEARWWRNACLLYFQQFSNMPFPGDIEQPEGKLQEYIQMQFPYAPGIRPSW